jgi:conjugative transfer region protein TrbK
MTSFRTLAVLFLAGAVLPATMAIADRPPQAALPSLAATAADPRNVELRRCQELGAAAQQDAACREAWRKNRERFFRHGLPREDRAIDPFPTAPALKQPVPLPPREPPSVPE